MTDLEIEGLLQRLDERTKRMDQYLTERVQRLEAEQQTLHKRIDKNRDRLEKVKGKVGAASSADSSRSSALRVVLEIVALLAAITLGIIGIFV